MNASLMKEIAILKKRVKKLEKRKRSRTQVLKHCKIGDAKQVVIAATKVVNVGVSVSTAEPKTPPTTRTTTLLEDDDVIVAATLIQMSETSKEKSIVFEDVEESAKEQREGKAPMHQGSWTSAQLKKLSDKEIKAKYERLVRSIANFVPMGAEERVKRLGPKLQSDTSKKQKTTKVKEHKEVDYEILDQRSPIIAWNSEYYGPKPLHDEVEVPEEINMNVVTRLNGSKSWKLHKSTGVHTLETDTEMVIHMLVEKKYPLMKKVLLQMLELKLESEETVLWY
ncbi:hypothetical protein Tco_0836051 [Tanacetum coccineum]